MSDNQGSEDVRYLTYHLKPGELTGDEEKVTRIRGALDMFLEKFGLEDEIDDLVHSLAQTLDLSLADVKSYLIDAIARKVDAIV